MTLSSVTSDKWLVTRDTNPSFWAKWNESKESHEITNYELGITSDILTAHFTEPQRAVASWQIVVVYDWEIVVGSWVII